MSLVIQEQVPLAPLSTIRVGGPARYFATATLPADVAAAADWASSRRLPVLLLGGGSNLIVSDRGFDGLVLHMAVRGLTSIEDGPSPRLDVGAGEVWDDVVRGAVARGWAGLECLSGIPGLVGATPIQNVGAYGQDVAETIERVEAVELATGRPITFAASECRFRYRESRFKNEDRGRYAIVRVSYRLASNVAPAVRYPDLAKALPADRTPTLAEVRDAVLRVRRAKSMVLDDADPCARSVGSFFLNPVLPPAAADAAEEELERRGHLDADEAMPRFPAGDLVKLSAAWLIERCGLPRGTRRGAVGLSQNHALAVVNYGGASAADVVSFAREVRDRVRERSGVKLFPEPVLVGVSLD
jgi:UDP-N-acetylmuramate dehydrogenase